ncbi:sensor histidine kinase [Variovorax saccharolyticus]|uniref:sensor histidine kinase n=1 Tax=Variovorax saccharolyticus TaxID=3053516 RepID=UPI002575120B|nr:ATP-binding protein [Variovorax sp. J31P216]MDM0026989.1 ATP-binding protein [Variovorax sp. J31P216]
MRPPLRPRSLRARLLLWLVALHLVAIAATVWFSYVAYGRLVNSFMDDQMRLVADSHATHHRPPALDATTRDDALHRGSFVVQVWSADGASLLASSWPGLVLPLQEGSGFSDVHLGSGSDDAWRVYTAKAGSQADAPRVQVVQNDGFRRQRIVRRALFESLPILLMLPVSLLILLLIVSAASRSLRAVARDVAAQEEGEMVEVAVARVPEEIAPLVSAYNSLLGRLRKALSTQRRFMQDAAHELRTPMAAIGLQIENLRAHVPAGDAVERFAQLESGVRRAQHLIEQLLRLSRQDAPAAAASGPVDVAMLLRDSVGQLMVLADQRRIDVGFEGPTVALVCAPPADLRSLFDNLIDNAVRYAREGGVVDVRLHEVDGQPVVDVLDDGPGIPPDQLQRVFDRFFRAAGAAPGGSGLGLAIAQAAALRNGLRIELANRADARGLRARVILPRSS